MSLLANESLAPPPQRPVLRLIAPFRTRRTKVLAVLACLSLVYLFVLASVPALRMDPGPLAQEQAEAIAAAQAHGPRWTKMPDLSMLSSNNKNMDSQEGDRVTENQPESEALTLETKLEQLISTHPIMVFSKSYCPYSAAAKKLLRSYTDAVQVMEVDLEPQSDEIKQILTRITHGHSTFPSVFLDGVSIGGSDSLHALDTKGELALAIVRMGVPMKVDRG